MQTIFVTTIICTYFFDAKSVRLQLVLVSLLSLILSLSFVVVAVLGQPYRGDWKLQPDQFTRVQTKPFAHYHRVRLSESHRMWCAP
jgi:hypothetical protein